MTPDPAAAPAVVVGITPEHIIAILLLGGLMGLFGQGVRAVIGLKSMVDDATATGQDQNDLFSAARLLVSLVIGFLAGIAAVFALGDWSSITDVKTLLGLAAAGYAGTDAIEGFISRYLPQGPAVEKAAPAAASTATAPIRAAAAEDPDAMGLSAPPSTAAADVTDQISSVQAQLSTVLSSSDENSLPTLSAKIDEVHALLSAAALSHGAIHPGDITAGVNAVIVKKMFPQTPLANISKNLPFVLAGLREVGLTDKDMVNMALSTIRAETEGFVPISEGRSSGNTLRTPFDLYNPPSEHATKLGNTHAGDGPLFKGRGFVQLTGRSNYTHTGPQVGADLVSHPDLANDPALAGKILAHFLKNKEDPIRAALAKHDLKTARKLVNGGSNGLARFIDSFGRGIQFLPA